MPKGFGTRTYQHWIRADDLCSFRVVVRETELFILASEDLSELATQATLRCRSQIEAYSRRYPEFQTSFTPLAVEKQASSIIQEMASAAQGVGVGPFAAVAGSIAEYVGKALLECSAEVVVENGGDIFVASTSSRIFGIYAGNSVLTGKIGIRIETSQMPCGVCSSSGTVGHSTSFGHADAAVAIAQSTALADACATALGNRISTPSDIPDALAFAEGIDGVDGAVVILGDQIGAWGEVQFVKTSVSDKYF